MRAPSDFTEDFRVPSYLDDLLKEHVTSTPGELKNLEMYRHFLGHLCKGLSAEFHRQDVIHGRPPRSDRWYVPLSSLLLKKIYGKRYNHLVSMLIEWNIVGRGKSYCPSYTGCVGRCKAFWLMGRSHSKLYRRLDIIRRRHQGEDVPFHIGGMRDYTVKDRRFLARIYLAKLEYKCEVLRTDAEIHNAHAHLAHFRINTAEAIEVLRKGVESGEVTARKYELEARKVDRFNRSTTDPAALYVKRDPYGRMHTNITSIRSDIRDKCLYCDGVATGAVDIKSSQASFLSSLFLEFLRLYENPLYRSDNGRFDVEPFWKTDGKGGFARIDADYGVFTNLLRNGQLYEFWAKTMGGYSGRRYTRKEAKKAFLAMLFDRISVNGKTHPERVDSRRVWMYNFPTLLRIIDHFKTTHYARLAHAMQQAESSFIFKRVIPRVERELGCHWCTVHDSVIVPWMHVSALQRIVNEELARAGIPTLTEQEMFMANPDWKTDAGVMMAEYEAMVAHGAFSQGSESVAVSG